MALFSFGKKKKKQEPAQSTAPGNPIQQIMSMQQQGVDNNTIIQEMQRQGYNSSQIYDAMNQLQMQGPPPGGMPPEMQQGLDMPPMPQTPPKIEEDNTESAENNRALIEEIAEAIIDEKWKEFEDDLRKIIEWKEQSDAKLAQLSQHIEDISSSLNSLHKNMLNKISEYDRNIVDVGTEIKAMEKVFQKVLPSLTENVNKLERMSKGSKTAAKK